MGFLSDIAGIAIKGALGYATSVSDVKAAAKTLAKAEVQNGWVTAEEFLDAYDVRIYNLEDDQYDIKIMKEHDFPGGYVLWNRSKDLYHTGIGSDVYKKVERHFRGYGNEAVFADSENGDSFLVSLFRLDNTEYDDLQELGNALRREFGCYPNIVASDSNDASAVSEKSGILGFLGRLFS